MLKGIKQWVYKMRLWVATRVLMNTGMVIVNAEDWKNILSTTETLHRYVRTSGHINNLSRKRSRVRCARVLHRLTENLNLHQQRFVHAASKGRMIPEVVYKHELKS